MNQDFSNADFVQSLLTAPAGTIKKASDGSSDYIRDRLRESAIFPNIITPVPVSYSDLQRWPTSELGVMLDEYEPGNAGSRAVPFGGSPDTVQYRGKVFVTSFGKEVTAEYAKLVDELATYKMDLRQVTTDNALKDLDNRQDTVFFATVDAMVGSPTGVGDSGSQQSFEVQGAISRKSYKDALNNLSRLDVPNGVWVLNQETANEWVGFDHNEWGGPGAEDNFRKGLSGALSKTEILGVPHIVSIKRAIIPFNRVYQFTTQQFLGKHYTLQPPTMYVERKDDMIRWYATRKYGARIANVKGATVQTWV